MQLSAILASKCLWRRRETTTMTDSAFESYNSVSAIELDI